MSDGRREIHTAGIVLLALFGDKIRAWDGEAILRCALAMMMVLCE